MPLAQTPARSPHVGPKTALFAFGLIVFAALSLGQLWAWTIPAPWGDPTPGILKAPPHYYKRTLSLPEARLAFAELRQSSARSEEAAKELLEIVSHSFVHSEVSAYQLNPFDNWIMWIRSLYDPRAKVSQDGNVLWNIGHGFCDQAATVYVMLAHELGFRSRLLWLGGHVVAEILVPEKGGRVVDPDLGIWWNFSSEELSRGISEETIQDGILQAGYDETLAGKLSKIYVSTNDNKATGLPYLPELAAFEQRSQWASLAISMIGILVCAGGLLRR